MSSVTTKQKIIARLFLLALFSVIASTLYNVYLITNSIAIGVITCLNMN